MGQFETVSEFIAMGSHGPFVWVAYASAVLALAGNWLALRQLRRRVMKRIQQSRLQEAE